MSAAHTGFANVMQSIVTQANSGSLRSDNGALDEYHDHEEVDSCIAVYDHQLSSKV